MCLKLFKIILKCICIFHGKGCQFPFGRDKAIIRSALGVPPDGVPRPSCWGMKQFLPCTEVF